MRYHFLLLVALLLPSVVTAQGLLTNFGIDPNANFGDFLNTLYAIAIAIAALLAVIKIAIGGLKYMLSEVVTSKADAKKDIRGAILGLLIVIGAFLILGTINSQLVGGSIGDNLTQLQAPAVATSTPTSATLCAYSAFSAPGYTWIPISSPPCQINQFEADCVAPQVLTSQYFGATNGGQRRCVDPIDATSLARLSPHTSSMSAAERTSAEEIYNDMISSWEITNGSTLTTIQTNNGFPDLVYAVDLTGYPMQYRSTIEAFCEQRLQTANPGGTYDIVYTNATADSSLPDDLMVCVVS